MADESGPLRLRQVMSCLLSPYFSHAADELTFNEYFRFPTSYARDRDRKNRFAYNKSAYEKSMCNCKLEDRFQKKVSSQSRIDKRTAYDDGLLNWES